MDSPKTGMEGVQVPLSQLKCRMNPKLKQNSEETPLIVWLTGSSNSNDSKYATKRFRWRGHVSPVHHRRKSKSVINGISRFTLSRVP